MTKFNSMLNKFESFQLDTSAEMAVNGGINSFWRNLFSGYECAEGKHSASMSATRMTKTDTMYKKTEDGNSSVYCIDVSDDEGL